MINYNELLKKNRKKSLKNFDNIPITLDYGKEVIKKIIPHREPFLFLDRLTGIDFNEYIITGSFFIKKNDPVFLGYFPGNPVFPGVLQLEMIGQLGLCLYYFNKNQNIEIKNNANPVNVRATRVLGAIYTSPIHPDSTIFLIAKSIEYDEFFGRIIGQSIVKGEVCCTVIHEVYFVVV